MISNEVIRVKLPPTNCHPFIKNRQLILRFLINKTLGWLKDLKRMIIILAKDIEKETDVEATGAHGEAYTGTFAPEKTAYYFSVQQLT